MNILYIKINTYRLTKYSNIILKMKIKTIKTIKTDDNHWTTQWIPISYKPILSNLQINKSLTFIWTQEYNLFAMCRAYYINKNIIEIGDVWLNEQFRGQKINDEKISIIFLKKVISKIWKLYSNAKLINLIVSEDNIPAIKLYERLKFICIKSISNKKLGIKNGLLMSNHININ